MSAIFKQKITFIYLGLFIICFAAAGIVGIPDNPPGLLLVFLSSIFLVLAFTHGLSSVKSYVALLLGSIIGFVVFAALHGPFEELGKGTVLEWIGVLFFMAAIFICPAGVLIGAVGGIIASSKKQSPVS